jgi:hypothetical protein
MEQKSKAHQCRRQPSALAHRTKQEFDNTPHQALLTDKIICLEARGKFLFFEGCAWLALSCPDKLLFPAASMRLAGCQTKSPSSAEDGLRKMKINFTAPVARNKCARPSGLGRHCRAPNWSD